MKIKFRINYHTRWGQNLYVSMKNGDTENAVPLHYTENGDWEGQTIVDDVRVGGLSYKYFIREEGREDVWEWGPCRRLRPESLENGRNFMLLDAWRPQRDDHNVLFSYAFTGNLFSREKSSESHRPPGAICRLQLTEPRIEKDYAFCVVGSAEALGSWNPEKALQMNDADYPVWSADIVLEKGVCDIEYKYGIYDLKLKKLIAWEQGPNRVLTLGEPKNGDFFIKTDLKFDYGDQHWRGAGVAIPVFSLRTEDSYGIGEFHDLKKLVDWAVKTGMKLVQILPVNDTVAEHTWKDSYPYSAISVMALHPVYLHLPAMGKLKDEAAMEAFAKEGKKLNALPKVDYEAVMRLKSKFYKELYDQERDHFLEDKGFRKFFEGNKEWLVPYAAFSMLRDRFGTADFTQWGEYAHYRQEQIDELTDPAGAGYDDIAVHYFIQYHLHLQMKDVTEYARKKGVVLKGDLPIGIYRKSVDAWMFPHLFHMDKQAGAPPDAYAVAGQNWGFPTYNWEEMAKDGYTWWRKRLTKMAEYFDAYRIDHILGFFRIWEIPWEHVEGLMGRFSPAIPMFLYEMAGNGLHFDYDRFCKPYIKEYMLDELFGHEKEAIIEQFLVRGDDGLFHLKEEYGTQRKVKEHFDALLVQDDDRERWLKIRQGLYTLIGNVLFFEDEESNGQGFHPRIALHYTYSFKELDDAAKAAIDRIYIHYFYERQEELWREKAMVKLPAIINASNMMVCGEDLGMVPDCVPGVMEELNILNLEIQRMPKKQGREFDHPAESKYLSVVSPSCHDMSTVRAWWEEDRERTARYFQTILGHHGTPPEECEPWVCREIMLQHLYAPAMWAIFPIQDLVGMDERLRYPIPEEERINDPANSEQYWQYRFHMNIEQLLGEGDFNDMLLDMIRLSGRGD